MLYIKDGYPELNELVICKVLKISKATTFVNLEEYNKEGILIISELSPGRIRSMNEFVQVDKMIVCKIIKVSVNLGQIHLSLRRVSQINKKKKTEEIKQLEFCEKIYLEISKKLNLTKDELFEKTYEEIFENYEEIFECFYEIMIDNKKIDIFKSLSTNEKKEFVDSINKKIKPEKFVLKQIFKIRNLEKNGCEIVKNTIEESTKCVKNSEIKIIYLASGTYEFTIFEKDKKLTEDNLKLFKSNLETNSKNNNCELEF
jgi:translation initiation factor 2 alpha subunit (eIF-2alpha)